MAPSQRVEQVARTATLIAVEPVGASVPVLHKPTSTALRQRHRDRAAVTDSFITSPSWPVSVTRPLPGMRSASTTTLLPTLASAPQPQDVDIGDDDDDPLLPVDGKANARLRGCLRDRMAFVPVEPHLSSVWRHKLGGGLAAHLDLWVSLVVLVGIITVYSRFLTWHEFRQDIDAFAALADPLLPHWTARDLSLPLFCTAYGSLVLALVYAIDKPNLLIEVLQTHSAVILTRMVRTHACPLLLP